MDTTLTMPFRDEVFPPAGTILLDERGDLGMHRRLHKRYSVMSLADAYRWRDAGNSFAGMTVVMIRPTVLTRKEELFVTWLLKARKLVMYDLSVYSRFHLWAWTAKDTTTDVFGSMADRLKDIMAYSTGLMTSASIISGVPATRLGTEDIEAVFARMKRHGIITTSDLPPLAPDWDLSCGMVESPPIEKLFFKSTLAAGLKFGIDLSKPGSDFTGYTISGLDA